jgi:hypothetical protein
MERTRLPGDDGAAVTRTTRAISPRGWQILSTALAAIGFILLAKALIDHGIQDAGGGGGIDALAYWTAARHLAVGVPIYTVASGSFLAYTYPPPLAQLLLPFSNVPLAAFVWGWRALELLGLRVATGSWVRSGIALLVFPPIIAELDAANVHLIMAGVCALVMRGNAASAAPAALLKFASAALLPVGWVRDGRGVLVGVGIALGVIGISILTAPQLWADYIGFIATARFPSGWYNLAEAIPVPVRVAIAGVVAIAAMRWVRLAPLAVLLAYPVLWFHALSTLVAVFTPIERRPGPSIGPAAAPRRP